MVSDYHKHHNSKFAGRPQQDMQQRMQLRRGVLSGCRTRFPCVRGEGKNRVELIGGNTNPH
jgi:hypothetical protein